MRKKALLILFYMIFYYVLYAAFGIPRLVQSGFWKTNGSRLGDFIEFDKNIIVKYNTIYFGQNKKFRIIFATSKYMLIQSIATSEFGLYVNKY